MIGINELIGKSLSDKDVISLLILIKKDPNTIKIKRGDIDAVVENKKLGIQLTFEDFESIEGHLLDPDIDTTGELSKKLDYMKSLPEGMLFLAAIDIDDVDDNKLSENMLPKGVRFGMTKKEVYDLLGKPDLGEDSEFNTAGWMFSYYKYAARFSDSDELFSFGVNFMENSHLIEF